MPTTAHSPVPDAGERCPCLGGAVFSECCDRFLSGAADAPTAVQLMRSRYTAFAVGDTGYLLATWHPGTRPDTLELETGLEWYRLEILDAERGGPFDRDGMVEFRASHRSGDERGVLHERSRFSREGRRWFYVDGVV